MVGSQFAALAETPRVSVTDLTGQPMPPVNRTHSQAHVTVPAIRVASPRGCMECCTCRRPSLPHAFHLYFGPANVAIWEVAIGVEAGEGPKVMGHVMCAALIPA